MNDFCIYEWIRLDNNEPFYVGKGFLKRSISFNNRNRYFWNIVNKVGIENIAVNILESNLNEEDALKIECWYIEEYRDMGYKLSNIAAGGEGVAGLKHTIESRLKMGEGVKKALAEGRGFKYQTPESKIKIGLANTGSKNGMYGKGYKVAGEKNPWFGKIGPRKGIKHSEETLNKISKKLTNLTSITLYKDNNFYKEYFTVRELKNDLELIVGGKLGHGIKALLNGWVPTKRSQLYGWSIIAK